MTDVDERRRSKLYEHCRQTWDEETAETLMALLPSTGWANVATKQDVAVLGSELRAEMAVMRAELGGRIDGGLSELRAEMQGLRAEMHKLISSLTWRFNGALLAGMGLAAAIARYG